MCVDLGGFLHRREKESGRGPKARSVLGLRVVEGFVHEVIVVDVTGGSIVLGGGGRFGVLPLLAVDCLALLVTGIAVSLSVGVGVGVSSVGILAFIRRALALGQRSQTECIEKITCAGGL